MRRISGLSTSSLLVLVCALLLTNEVKCQDDSTDAPSTASVPAGDAGDATGQTPAPDASDSTGADSAVTQAPGDLSVITVNTVAAEVSAVEAVPIMPEVKCVGKEEITESNAVKASVATNDCATTKRIIEAVPAYWCSKQQACTLNLHQDANTVLLESEGANLGTLASALQSEEMKPLGARDVKYSSSSGSSVFVGILVTGLLAALALTVGYFKCQRRPSPKGERLAEEGTPVDQQNQANTLASDAPLNPPPETPEKPSANGEAPEGDKTPAPPTNGHSTPANTADTEL
ncbi:hypothetical protein NL108_012318 [Boleophthalmus pectinirostris]|uniref:uncharacterized protein cd34 n=1 Tax=Boleophthalmus pectinirostris TaxID=150288 RepID=UPI00242E7818|nr:uncharacterized protein cd34 [Boleophthalmus pectinirostris]KAJ0064715.1 hypothetical protein NL108_012318 [Boleophthalmus pectinirostris]